jgi:hypothetical protein
MVPQILLFPEFTATHEKIHLDSEEERRGILMSRVIWMLRFRLALLPAFPGEGMRRDAMILALWPMATNDPAHIQNSRG